MALRLTSLSETLDFATAVGRVLRGGEVIELVGDVGAGKTTFTKGLAKGLGVQDDIQSPSFTISRAYDARDGIRLLHYDFYRLTDPGLMAHDIAENSSDAMTVVVVEWGETISAILPADRIVITLKPGVDDTEREVTIQSKVTTIGDVYAAWHKN